MWEYFTSSKSTRWIAICLDDLLKLNIYVNQFLRILRNCKFSMTILFKINSSTTNIHISLAKQLFCGKHRIYHVPAACPHVFHINRFFSTSFASLTSWKTQIQWICIQVLHSAHNVLIGIHTKKTAYIQILCH